MSLSQVEELVNATIASAVKTDPPLRNATRLAEDLTRAGTGGKRFRARLLLTAHEAFGGDYRDAAVHVAAALELFQLAALIHDDVLDGSDTRRGMPSLHRALEKRHADLGRHGDAAWAGMSGAVLAGDLLLIALPGLLSEGTAELPPSRRALVHSMFTSMGTTCTVGQYLDMEIATTPMESLTDWEASAFDVMRTKTASYTSEFPLGVAAAITGKDAEVRSAAMSLGRDLGVAFQLRDDVLGLVGDEATTGKPAGDDIAEGKRTLVMAWAWHAAQAHDREVLAAALGQRDAPAPVIAAAVEVVRKTGAIDRAEAEISRLADIALAGLGALPMTSQGHTAIAQLAHAAAFRTA